MREPKTSIIAILNRAKEFADRTKQREIRPEHLLVAMTMTGGIESKTLTYVGVSAVVLQDQIIQDSEPQEGAGNAQLDNVCQQILKKAEEYKPPTELQPTGAEILRALMMRKTTANLYLLKMGIRPQDILEALDKILSLDEKEDNVLAKLEEFGTNLNEKAKKGKIDPVIGREKEIDRTIQILSRRKKNNPILIGEPGVGKTAIAEGLAYRIVKGDVQDVMKNRIIFSLEVSRMVAGTKYRGDFEKRMETVIKEVKKHPEVILFIDEFHLIIGAGGSKDGGDMDAANILKPHLVSGEMQIIGATTIDEYRKTVEKDAALERRFQQVLVEEPTKKETVEILKGLRKYYENHHKVKITDEAIHAAVDLTDRYIFDRYLPDKAIDVIDEAQARMRIDAFSFTDRYLELQKKLEEVQEKKSRAANAQQYEDAIKYKEEEDELLQEINEEQQSMLNPKVYPVLTRKEVEQIVSDWSGVPVTGLTEDESEKLLHLEDRLKKSVIGQDEAIEVVARATRRARVGLKNPNRPTGAFLFVGPTGVGKTYLAKMLAKEVFMDEKALIRFDMSEFSESYSVSRLLGSAPGYVGYEEGGQLTEAVRKRPYSVVLFDEIEKAHPSIFQVFLQVLDEGRLTDAQGREVDFKNTILIMTSNLGAKEMETTNRLGFSHPQDEVQEEYERKKEIVDRAIKNTFRPEFLNRLDDIVHFRPLGRKELREIAKLQLQEVMDRVGELGYDVRFTDNIVDRILDEGYDAEYGARPLKRAITEHVEDLLADKILKKELSKDSENKLCIRQDEIVVARE